MYVALSRIFSLRGLKWEKYIDPISPVVTNTETTYTTINICWNKKLKCYLIEYHTNWFVSYSELYKQYWNLNHLQ